jgi:conjugal transfer pilus assembly protein TraW
MVVRIIVAMLILSVCFNCLAQDSGSSDAVVPTGADPASPPASLANSAAQSEEITAQAAALARIMRGDPGALEIAKLSAKITEGVIETHSPPHDAKTAAIADRQQVRIRLFISQSMPVEMIDAALASAQSSPQSAVVIRGFTKDQKLGDMFRFVRARIAAGDTTRAAPNVELDPARFAEADVSTVPALVAYSSGKPIAWLRGSVSVARIEKRIEDGATGDLGKEGVTYPVAESDFIDILKARAAAVDEPALRQKAMDQFWTSRKFTDVPDATETREFTFDPTFTVVADVKTPTGAVIARAGTKINPLDRVPFAQRIIVFDLTKDKQLSVVAGWLKDAGERRVTLLTTQVDPLKGWQQLARARQSFGRPVYLLTPQIEAQFHISHVPSLVVPDGRVFRVSEVHTDTKDDSNVDTHAPPR